MSSHWVWSSSARFSWDERRICWIESLPHGLGRDSRGPEGSRQRRKFFMNNILDIIAIGLIVIFLFIIA